MPLSICVQINTIEIEEEEEDEIKTIASGLPTKVHMIKDAFPIEMKIYRWEKKNLKLELMMIGTGEFSPIHSNPKK